MDFINTFIERKLNKKTTHNSNQRIWAIDLMERWFCIWDDLANPKNKS